MGSTYVMSSSELFKWMSKILAIVGFFGDFDSNSALVASLRLENKGYSALAKG